MRRVQRYAQEFVKRWNRFGRPTGGSWRVNATYVKLRGRWLYLYRALDRVGRTVDFRLSAWRDVAAAKAFFKKAIKSQGGFRRNIAMRPGIAARPTPIRKPASRSGSLQTKLGL